MSWISALESQAWPGTLPRRKASAMTETCPFRMQLYGKTMNTTSISLSRTPRLSGGAWGVPAARILCWEGARPGPSKRLGVLGPRPAQRSQQGLGRANNAPTRAQGLLSCPPGDCVWLVPGVIDTSGNQPGTHPRALCRVRVPVPGRQEPQHTAVPPPPSGLCEGL